ncbi:hypothetical protein Tco_0986557, partial [Tanacetum coccineum]
CDPEVLSEVPYFDSYPNDMINQDVQEMQHSEQTHVGNFQDNEIHSGSNIIMYSQYLQESQDAVIQDTNPSTPNNLLSQEKDTVIRKLKERIKSLSGKDSVENVKKDIETINIELEHSVAKLLSENENLRKEREHLKSIYKDQFESIRKTSLKNELRKLKGKNVVSTTVQCLNVFFSQELLVYVSQTCRSSPKSSGKLVAVSSINKDKRVRFAKPVTSSNNIHKQTDSLKTKDSNKPLLTSTRVKPTTSASGSKPSGNTMNNRIT